MPEEPQTTKDAPEKTGQKVELDLDDAPFLKDEPEAAPAPAKEPESAPSLETPLPPQPPAGLLQRLLASRKKLAMAVGGGVVLAVAAVFVNVFLFPGGERTPVPPPPEPEKVAITPKPPPAAATPRFVMQFEPFWVELKDTEGASRFFTLKFSIPSDNEILFGEMNAKALVLRDALFYYLRNQPILSLSNESRAQAFKEDLMTVINEHLGSGKISEVLIQDYLIQ